MHLGHVIHHAALVLRYLVMLVPSDAADIVPSVCLVAEIALFDTGVFLARHHHRDHAEVAHVVAGWRLVALRALGRAV